MKKVSCNCKDECPEYKNGGCIHAEEHIFADSVCNTDCRASNGIAHSRCEPIIKEWDK